MSSRTAPGELEVLRRFLNSERRSDRLVDSASTQQWLEDHDLVPAGGESVTAGDVASLRLLRSALTRLVDGEEVDGTAGPGGIIEMEVVLGDGEIRLRPTGPTPAARAIAALVRLIDRATVDGSLPRLKRCDECHWAFYDSSRNRSRRWCDMAVCGNRVNVQRFRQRQSGVDERRAD